MGFKWIGPLCIVVLHFSCSVMDENPNSIETPISSSQFDATSSINASSSSEISSAFEVSSFSELSSSTEVSSSLEFSSSLDVSSSSEISSSSVWPPPPVIQEYTLVGISADSIRSLLRLPATPPAQVQTLMHLWDSLAPSYIDTLLSPSLDSSWMLRTQVAQDWCTFEPGSYNYYSYREETFSIDPSITWRVKVYQGEKQIYSSNAYSPKTTLHISESWTCHSFGIPIEPLGCGGEGVHVLFPDSSHLEAMPPNIPPYSPHPYTWTPSGIWQPNNEYYQCFVAF